VKQPLLHLGGEYGQTVRNSLSNPVCRVPRLERVRWEQRKNRKYYICSSQSEGKDWL